MWTAEKLGGAHWVADSARPYGWEPLRLSANAEPDVADGFCAEAFLQFSQDVDLGDLLELVMQSRLENADAEDAFTQRDWSRVGGDKFADDF